MASRKAGEEVTDGVLVLERRGLTALLLVSFFVVVMAAFPVIPGAGFRGGAAIADDYSTSKKIWILKLEHGRPERVTLGKEPNLENFWYLPFTLTNEDAEPHSFFLDVTAVSDKDHHYNDLSQPQVKEKVRRRLGLKPTDRLWARDDLTMPAGKPADYGSPLPQPLELSLPAIQAGETIQCVAIFHGFDPEMDSLAITVKGLTNDVEVLKTRDDETKAELPPHERRVRERVLVLRYERPGDEYYRTIDPIEFVGREWVTVERVIKTDLE